LSFDATEEDLADFFKDTKVYVRWANVRKWTVN
jgi:hypothetical protein